MTIYKKLMKFHEFVKSKGRVTNPKPKEQR